MKVLLFLTLVIAVVYSQTVSSLDPFTGISGKISVAGTSSETFFEGTTGVDILGGERDMIIIGTGTGSSSNCESESFVENGSWYANNGQTCSAAAILQYDGADSSANRAMGLNVNLNSVGVGFLIDIQTDLASSFIIRIYSTNSDFSQITQPVQASSSLLTYFFPFSDFQTGGGNGASFTDVGAIELEITANLNTDVIVTLFDIVANEASGRVFSDCNCDGVMNESDGGLVGHIVTASPGSSCPDKTTVTAVTDVNGDWFMDNLQGCSYTFSTPGTCSTSPDRTIDVSTSPDSINFGIEQAGSLEIPVDITITCDSSTDESVTGTAICSAGTCGGSGGSVSHTDSIVAGRCDTEFVIVRTFTCGGETGVQQITVTSTNANPNINVPDQTAAPCTAGGNSANTDPDVTGRATATAQCSSAVTVTFSDESSNSCNQNTCTNSATITRTWVATDNCGRTSSGVQIITDNCGVVVPPSCPPLDDDFDCAVIEIDEDDFCACPADDDSDSSSGANVLFFSALVLLISFIFTF